MSAIHVQTVDALNVLIQEMRRGMIKHIAKKIDLDPDELVERYCDKPVDLKMCNTINIKGIAIQDGPVFLTPPVPSKPRSVRTKAKKETVTDEELFDKLSEKNQTVINNAIQTIREECVKVIDVFGERMKKSEIIDKKETRSILKPLDELFSMYEMDGIITKKQRMNRFNRNLTNILHGADPSKDKRLREIAKENPELFFENLIARVKRSMIENLS
jgi:adenylate kinase family enzyme